MKDTILAVFSSVEHANEALRQLAEEGYTEADVSVITREDKVDIPKTMEDADTTSGAVGEGVKKGGLVGGLVGLLVGVGALTIPGIGALFIGGPLAAAFGITGVAATTATGALTGALAGGLVGALTNIGVDDVQARVLEDRVRQGDVLIMVVPTENDAEHVKEIFRDHGAEHLSQNKLNI